MLAYSLEISYETRNVVTIAMPHKSLALVDGSGFVHRAFHAVKTPLNRPSDGMLVGAVLGFINSVTRLMEQHMPTQGVIVFDTSRRTFRHELDPTYKAQRSETPKDLIQQFQEVFKACETLGWPLIKAEGVEADDVIATLTHQQITQGNTVIIYSSDKDFIQLLRKGVQIYDPFKESWVTDSSVYQRYGVTPQQFLDFQSLMGDSSDNVKGVPSVGPKTAAQLLNQFESLESLLANLHQVSSTRLRGVLETHSMAARHAHNLLTLRQDVKLSPLDFTLKPLDATGLLAFLHANNFLSLKKRFEKGFLSSYLSDIVTQDTFSLPSPSTKLTFIETHKASSWLKQAQSWGRLVLIVDSSENVIKGVLPPQETTPSQGIQAPLAYTPHNLCTQTIEALLNDKSVLKICSDVKAIWHTLTAKGWPLSEDNRTSGLWDDVTLMASLCGKKLSSTHEVGYANDPLSLVTQHHHVRKTLCHLSQMTLYKTLERPLLSILYDMERWGIMLECKTLKQYELQVNEALARLEEDIIKLAGQPFNPASPQQLSVVLEGRLSPQQKKAIKKTKHGSLHTDAETLESLDTDPFISAVLSWRQLKKIKTTYIDTLPHHCDAQGRIHTTYVAGGAKTGRLSSIAPNMQNIPTVNSSPIRHAFKASPGWQLISFDYAHIELRLLAHIGPVKLLAQAFQEGRDVHAQTASHILGIPLDQITAAQRRQGKILNFSILYGLSGFRLAHQLGIPTSQANEIIKRFFKSDSGFQDYIQHTKESARTQGYVTTLLGRRCFIPHMKGPYLLRSAAERQAVNAPLQGSSADIIKKAMIDLEPLLHRFSHQARLLLQVHDELIFEIDPHIKALFIQKVHERLVSTVSLSVPLQVDCHTGETWGSMKRYTPQS